MANFKEFDKMHSFQSDLWEDDWNASKQFVFTFKKEKQATDHKWVGKSFRKINT